MGWSWGICMGLDALRYWLQQDHVFIYDSAATRSYKQLRALPALAYLGFTVFTYPKSWSQIADTDLFTLYKHDHTHIDEIQTIENPLCVITNQNYEEHTPDSIGKLRNIQRDSDGRLAILADNKQFQIQGAKRPLRDQHNVTTRSYQGVFNAFEEHYADGGYIMPLSDTQNLFLQDNAILFQEVTGQSLNSAEELFGEVQTAPYLPLYGSLCRVFNRDESFGASPLTQGEIDAFADWLRRRIEFDNKTAEKVTETLNKQVLEDQNNFAHATRVDHPTMRKASRYLTKIDSASNSLERRLSEWIKEVAS